MFCTFIFAILLVKYGAAVGSHTHRKNCGNILIEFPQHSHRLTHSTPLSNVVHCRK